MVELALGVALGAHDPMLNLANALAALRRTLTRHRNDRDEFTDPDLVEEYEEDDAEYPPAPLPESTASIEVVELPAEEPEVPPEVPHAALPVPGTPLKGPTMESPEFEDLISALGSEFEAPTAEAIVARKDAEIGELRRMLVALRPLGDRLAAIDKARLTGAPETENELAETRAQLVDERFRAAERKKRFLAKLRLLGDQHAALQDRYDRLQKRVSGLPEYVHRTPKVISGLKAALEQMTGELEQRDAKIDELHTTLRKREGDLKRTKGWHERARVRAEQKSRTAALRWKEILELRRQLKAAQKELRLAEARARKED